MKRVFLSFRLSFPVRLWSAFFALALFAGGCANPQPPAPAGNSAPGNDDQATGQAVNASPSRAADLCRNPSYPVDPKTPREYRLSGAGEKTPSTFVLTQTLEAADSFVERRVFSSGMEVVNRWQCTAEGLRNLEYTNQISTANAQFNIETLESSGLTLPEGGWTVGNKWSTEYRIRANVEAGGASRTMDETVRIDNEITALTEKVTVPAGEFDAARVNSVIRMNFSIRGQKMPGATIRSTSWYAPQIGLVRQESATGFGTGTVEYLGTK